MSSHLKNRDAFFASAVSFMEDINIINSRTLIDSRQSAGINSYSSMCSFNMSVSGHSFVNVGHILTEKKINIHYTFGWI